MFGGPHDAGILDGIEERFAIAPGIGKPLLQKRQKLLADFLFAGLPARHGIMAIARRVVLPGRQAAIARARLPRRGRIHPVEISKNRRHGRSQTVNVEAAKFHPRRVGSLLVFVPQPACELQDLLISPHPAGKAGKGLLA